MYFVVFVCFCFYFVLNVVCRLVISVYTGLMKTSQAKRMQSADDLFCTFEFIIAIRYISITFELIVSVRYS